MKPGTPEVDGVLVNGVDIIKWNTAGQVVDFKVMIRPLKAITVIQQRMAERLQGATPRAPLHADPGGDPAP